MAPIFAFVTIAAIAVIPGGWGLRWDPNLLYLLSDYKTRSCISLELGYTKFKS